MKEKEDRLERRFYPRVLQYLASQGYTTYSYDRDGSKLPFIARGQGQLIVDVYGLKGDKDPRTRAIESAAVEVKRKETNTPLRYIAQAFSYSRLAHRCYLAQPFDFRQPTLAEAARLGVGLLRIHDKKIELVAESKLFAPDPVSFGLFLNRSLRISQCAICGCYKLRYGPSESGARSGGGHWRTDDFTRKPRRVDNKWTYICADCENHWSPVGVIAKLHKRVEALEKSVARLKADHKDLKSKA